MAFTLELTTKTELLEKLKFPDSASKSIVDQGFVELKELKELGVQNLCKIIRNPGGPSQVNP
eukprot:13024224-Ditylum_brightwellii.AAC.2